MDVVNSSNEGCRVEYLDDYALATVTVRLEYHSEHREGDETLPSQPHSLAFDLLSAAVERYLCRTLGHDTSRQGRLLKPCLHVIRPKVMECNHG